MIIIEIEPTKVKRVAVEGRDGLDQDLLLLVWPLIRPHVERIDRQLRRDGTALLDRLCPHPPASGENQPINGDPR